MDSDETESRMVPIHVCWGNAEADVVASFLAAHGIESSVNAEGPRSVYPMNVDGLGQLTILVPEAKFETARNLLSEKGIKSVLL